MSNNKYPLISIAIPTYNRAETFLKQALPSALNQTYSNIEIIVSDNCSTDNTEEVVKSFNDPRIRYFRQKVNIGSVPNSNFCLEQARGDYYLLHHDDDLIDTDFLETSMKAANYSKGIGMIRTGTRVIDSTGNVKEVRNPASGLSPVEFFRGWFANKFTIYLCSTLFNTKKLKEIGGFKSIHNLFDDVVAYAKLIDLQRVDIEDVKASFRKHGNEETFAVKVDNWIEDSFYLLDVICKSMPEKDRSQIKQEGMKFLARINYNRARGVKSLSHRFRAYLTVFTKFNYRYLPPRSHIVSPLVDLLNDTLIYKSLRSVKQSMSKER